MELIHVSHLHKKFGSVEVLRDLSVDYHTGMIYGLVGENGAGKTTFFNCVMGLTEYEGVVRKKPDLSVGYLPAENFFYSLITGQEYLDFCIQAKGKPIVRTEIERLNENFQLPLQRYASDYSTGMKKKLALMGLLLQDNEMYILDEPFNGVDLYGCIHLKRLLCRLKEENKSVLLSSHQITVLHELCDSIDYLNRHTFVKRYSRESVKAIEEDILADMLYEGKG